MSTTSSFTVSLDISDVHWPAKSVGAHLAAKLQLFQTDERTLTDELCDMLCIWLQIQSTRPQSGAVPVTLTLSKTTAKEEAKIGADLELIVSSPLGSKRCLIQAKVLDPSTLRMRCDSVDGWKKLRKQLVAARKSVGDLAFLLIYVPGALLDGNSYGFGTYEQLSLSPPLGATPACYGATLVAVNDLLGPSGRWLSRKFKVPQLGHGRFKDGIPFWRILLELLLCQRSSWSRQRPSPVESSIRPFRTLQIAAEGMDPDRWRSIEDRAAYLLRESHDLEGNSTD